MDFAVLPVTLSSNSLSFLMQERLGTCCVKLYGPFSVLHVEHHPLLIVRRDLPYWHSHQE